MIDGLKLTMTGEELRRMLQDRADNHRASASRWSHESTRTPDEQTEEAPELLPQAPGWVEQDEYEERTRVGFELGRLARRVCFSPETIQITNPDTRTAE